MALDLIMNDRILLLLICLQADTESGLTSTFDFGYEWGITDVISDTSFGSIFS